MRFPIKFDRGYGFLSTVLLLLPSDSYVEVAGARVVVRMGWGFRAAFDRSAVSSAAPLGQGGVISRGVHGWNGTWLVNGSGDGIVRVNLEPTQRAWVMSVPVRLRELRVSVENPGGLIAALTV
jgi:hypothetical protein